MRRRTRARRAIVDLLAILPFWVERVVCSPESPCNSGVSVVRMLRLARIFRVLKAGNFAAELQVFVWGWTVCLMR